MTSNKKFIIPTKENKIAILCTTKEEFVEILSNLSDNCLLYKYSKYDWDCCGKGEPRYILWCNVEDRIDWRFPKSVPDNCKKITFQEAILTSHSKVAELLGIEDEQEFEFRGHRYKISTGTWEPRIVSSYRGAWSTNAPIWEIIAHPDEIKPILDDPEIINFIKKFQWNTELFANGMCYWFAHILHNRFENSLIEYHPIDNHFSCRIMNVNYDITGAIDGSGYVDWDEYQKFDPVHAERIKKYCIRKED